MLFIFSNAPATTEIYTLSLHDALPIYEVMGAMRVVLQANRLAPRDRAILTDDLSRMRDFRVRHDEYGARDIEDRKSTRLNSSHSSISYAVFCLKKKILDQSTIFHHCLI